ncbi:MULTISPECIES: STAS domain-containing protein [Methanocorpusculum]|jgi:anti-sigma B factor antagonist|uniref:STAS domain-containing protein n=1 Tax=Methanocorpusculum TaxID=2192 RepID=UPI0005B26D11|nr:MULTISPECIES: STAS domain-containing protein [Methanocorpusculum]MDD4423284.1 STAS domain-containing protein [Methanocorpusculum parvum]NCA78477.1 anti-sigma factor antagonist [Alphaproteobacteria bacterium]MDD2248666.1 STAS domain-containing protein [Methanocorpusculum sp.]MDD2803021.1 STAS domain-containing protein [Methanocorpusculum sp.]MDD3046968.1 STAS domain-containing protein [Methanocorpusculum sp.]
MKITKTVNESKLILELDGKLDTKSAPEFRRCAESSLDGISSITLNFAKLTYMSSVGLSIILTMKKMLGPAGTLQITNARGLVREVFEISGFDDLLAKE